MSVEVADLLRTLEADSSPVEEHAYFAPLNALAQRFIEREQAVPSELVAEQVAFLAYAADSGRESAWALYFGPAMSGTTQSGDRWESPSLRDITPEVLEYWTERARSCLHPVMRARYADLHWELSKRLPNVRRDVDMARVAIDSYLEAGGSRRYDHVLTCTRKAKRALEIGLAINDPTRVDRARDLILALDDGTADDDDAGVWGFAFDTLLDPPHDRVTMSAVNEARVVDDLEARLARLVTRPPTQYHPFAAEAAATRLAKHYRRVGRAPDVVRVLESFGEAVKAIRTTAPAFLTAHSLEGLYNLYRSFGMRAQADALNELLRAAGEEAMKDMKSISVDVPVNPESVERYFVQLLDGTSTEVLARIAAHFVPDRDKLEIELREVAKKAELYYLTPMVVKDDDGRTIARVGPLGEDTEGRLVQHIARHLEFNIPWLRQSFARGIAAGLISTSAICEFLFASPLYKPARRSIIERGVGSFVADDALAAIHILIPQLEQAIREVATVSGMPIYAQRRGGGLNLRTLDDLLRDENVEEVLGANVTTYLRILLTDARGWNLRNNVCHGNASPAMFSAAPADRVVHAMLIIGCFHERDVNSGGDADGLPQE